MQSQSAISRRLWSLAAPIIGINVLNVMTLAVDTIMCGRLPDADITLAALGYATQIVFLLMVAMMGLTVGTVALVARAYGAGDSERVNHVMVQSTMLTVLLGIAVGIAGNLAAPLLMRLMGASDLAVDEGMAYLRPLLGGAMFYYLTILYGGVFRAVGNTRLPFMIALAANALNVFLDYALILGNFGFPALGVQGAAIGTVVSYAFNVTVMVWLLRRGAVDKLYVPLTPRRIDGPLARQLFRIGFPAALDMTILNAAFLSIIGMLGRIDEAAVAAHGVGLRIQALAFVPGLGISQATGAMVGNALGEGDPDQARQVGRASVLLCVAIMSSLALIIVLAAPPIVGLFDIEAGTPLDAYAIEWMRLLGYCMPIAGVHIAMVGVLQGAGATRTSLSINFWSTVMLQIPLSAFLGFTLDLGAFGVWLAFPLSFVLRAGLGLTAFRRGGWARVGADV
ncbi:MAG TPA: MATE family efflux transporter [Kofleriaceae bacterium]|nr:MATE family efflux transporter [Kofleriaceae bacterium]